MSVCRLLLILLKYATPTLYFNGFLKAIFEFLVVLVLGEYQHNTRLEVGYGYIEIYHKITFYYFFSLLF